MITLTTVDLVKGVGRETVEPDILDIGRGLSDAPKWPPA